MSASIPPVQSGEPEGRRVRLQSMAFDAARRSVDDMCSRFQELCELATEDDLDELEAEFGDAILAMISRRLDAPTIPPSLTERGEG